VTIRVVVDDLSSPEVHALLAEHLAAMHATSPPESVHALDLSGLRAPGVTFWAAYDGASLAGCGALKDLGDGRGEVKSMRTASTHLRRGVAAAVLDEIVATARRRGWTELLLETGSTLDFAAAHALYGRFGFEEGGPFGDYGPDEFSRFYRLRLGPAGPS